MVRRRLLGLTTLLLVTAAGCSYVKEMLDLTPRTPREVIVTMDAAIVAAADETRELVRAGMISRETGARLHRILSGATAVVDQAREAAIRDPKFDIGDYIAIATQALAVVRAEIEAARTRKQT